MKTNDSGELAREAVHEAGHAVMARYLGLRLGCVWISGTEKSGETCVQWAGVVDKHKELLVLVAARACLRAFKIGTLQDQGGLGDEVQLRNILEDMHPEEDEASLSLRVAKLDAEADALFERRDIVNAARALAATITRVNEIDGAQAEAIIDRHLMSGQAHA